MIPAALGGLRRGRVRALLRTNLTRAARAREETIGLSGAASSDPRTFAGAAWRDIPLAPGDGRWELDLPLTEVGYFRRQGLLPGRPGPAALAGRRRRGHRRHPDHLRTGNTIYCAFPRMFGPGESRAQPPASRPWTSSWPAWTSAASP